MRGIQLGAEIPNEDVLLDLEPREAVVETSPELAQLIESELTIE